ncbi:uncharacterized protein LOC18428579 isoform X2 [Amborella trichopoda]|uniref:uncharacterized protein LOC18428579 isoform X2 n=1 Tax=Amborella trichopoda TaxID=13333 RepID=UPI0009C17F04|nr:uncharacterized protein LOC18428579 isoform X2 [Amborella trichopoda]|eukprot:XP_020519500.1 uncharacterized protein LOC18428579 isoform X2 [Amborella trichopoda]
MELSAIKPFSYFFQTLIHAPHSANSSSYKLKTFQKPSELQTAGTRAPLKMAQIFEEPLKDEKMASPSSDFLSLYIEQLDLELQNKTGLRHQYGLLNEAKV